MVVDFSKLITLYVEHFSYGGLFVFLILAGLGFPFPEEITLTVGGVLIAQEMTTPLKTFMVSVVGLVGGDLCLYMLGRRYGEWVFQHRWFAPFLTQDRLLYMYNLFERYGKWVVLGARFVTGIRVVAFFAAGSLRMSLFWFVVLDTVGALIFAPFFLSLGYVFAENQETWLWYIHRFDQLILFSLFLFCLIGGFVLFRRYYNSGR